MIDKIVTGGQTGVDQAALEIASELNIPISGWCPKGGLDENGVCILERFALQETETDIPNERTKLNVRDSDGTLIIVPTLPLPGTITDGTGLTIQEAEETKPHLIIALDEKEEAIDTIRGWIDENNIRILNIGGPRESSSPGIYEKTCELLRALLTPTLQCSY
ncbi:MAG: putative molybdenum carrier protein [Legionellaceae bacterium]|nr:putative molybdenum carrier protein [Legionellaceae bacterium]